MYSIVKMNLLDVSSVVFSFVSIFNLFLLSEYYVYDSCACEEINKPLVPIAAVDPIIYHVDLIDPVAPVEV